MDNRLKSPINSEGKVVLEKVIDTKSIFNLYQEQLNIDVSKYFKGLNTIKLFKCLDTGYKFFYPFDIEGDSKFYELLQKNPYYYMDWKWEYEKAFNLIEKDDEVLEIGCGKGVFLKKLSEKQIKAVGIELNEKARSECFSKGLIVFDILIKEYAKHNKEKYDVICSFQVLEHISNVGDFIIYSLNLLKNGGKLIISVPNNDSFIKLDLFNFLNMPPHHMGLWSEETFKKIQKFYNIKLTNIFFEPLQKYHFRYYYDIIFGRKIINKLKFVGRIIRLILMFPFCLALIFLSKRIKGHTILVEFIKI